MGDFDHIAAAGGFGALPPAPERPASRAWPTPEERARDFFWVARYPRPEAATWPYRYPSLADAQAEWDAARAKQDRYEAGVRERQAGRERAAREAKDARERGWLRKRMAGIEAELRAAYFGADPSATEEQFAADLPGLLADRRRQAALGVATDEGQIRPLIDERRALLA